MKDTNGYVYFDDFFTSPRLKTKLSENGIYGIGTVRENCKHVSSKTGQANETWQA